MNTSRQAKEAFKLALSMVLLYALALSLDWDLPKYGGLAIVLISLGTTGASLQKGVLRVIGTTAGLIVALAVLALFAQDRWLTLAVISAYLIVAAYFMQGSRHAYAWYVAAFLVPLVWSTTYGKVDHAFHYATFRYLETTAGIAIYTAVSALLWPVSAGRQLRRDGDDLWGAARKLFDVYRQGLGHPGTADASKARSAVATALTRLEGTLQAASSDTRAVIARRRAWAVLPRLAHSLSDAIEVLRESVGDCSRLDLPRLLPRLGADLETLAARMGRLESLWTAIWADSAEPGGAQLEPATAAEKPLQTRYDRAAGRDLAHLDRAALFALVHALQRLNAASRDVADLLGLLAAPDPKIAVRAAQERWPAPRRPVWQPDRLVRSLMPAACFSLAFLFWIVADPPTGATVPNMAATLSLTALLGPFPAVATMILVLGSIALVVAPIYIFVMPALNGGVELLALIFVYSFVFGFLGGRFPALKLGPMLMFVMMTGIGNQQSYSLPALLDPAIMMVLGFGTVILVESLVTPARPELRLTRLVRRFFRGCAGLMEVSANAGGPRHARFVTAWNRRFAGALAPALGQVAGLARRLDYRRFPGNPPEQVQCLASALQSLALRMRALRKALDRVAHVPADVWDEVRVTIEAVRGRARGIFERGARLEVADAADAAAEEAAISQLARQLETQLDAVEARDDPARFGKADLADFYGLLGALRGLFRTTSEAREAMQALDWDAWREGRF